MNRKIPQFGRYIWERIRIFVNSVSPLVKLYKSKIHPVNREHIVWSYRILLDREPENEAVILEKLNALRTTQELRLDIMLSPEFRLNNPENLAYTPERNIVIKELDDQLRLFLDLSDRAIGLNITKGCYEQSEIDFVRRTVKFGENILDIGANIGFFTISTASLVGASGRVYAFEPLDQNADLLERSIAENKFEDRVTLERVVVGSSSSSAKLVFLRLEQGAQNSGGAYLLKEGTDVPDGHEVKNVEMISLDEYPLRHPISFIKIDVEGAEPLVLRGAQKILQMDRPVILSELHPVQLEKVSSCTPAQFIAEMQTYGYDCHLLQGSEPTRKITDVNDFCLRSVVFLPKAN